MPLCASLQKMFSVLIVLAIASEIELRRVRRLIRAQRAEVRGGRACVFGTLQGRSVCLVKTGVGRKNAAAAARAICADLRPGLVIIAGAAGGLDPGLAPGAIVVVESVIRESTLEEIICPEAPVRRVLGVLSSAGMRPLAGRCCQANTFIHRAADKLALHLKTRAQVVDMESAACAQEFQRAGMPFVNLRVVSDAALRDTADMAALAGLRYRSGMPDAALYLCRHPREFMRAVSLYRGMHSASARLAEALSCLMAADVSN